MAVTFDKLLEGTELTESARQAIQEAWTSQLAEAKETMTAELREEFAQRYDHDKRQITEAVDTFITDKVTAEIAELVEDRKALVSERVKYRRAISEHAKVLDGFVTQMVAKEVKELRADRQRVSEHVAKLDNFVAEQLAEELKEFHEDKKALVEHKVKMVREGKRELAEAKKDFIRKAANTVESTINHVISEEVKSFRNDITSARENDFGRRIFEAFASEFGTSYLNEAKEIKKVQKQVTELQNKLVESVKLINKQQDAVKLTESKLRIANDRFARKQKLDELLRPLGKEKREIMSSLLESVKTDRLAETFNKYLPNVLDSIAPRDKRTLTESVKKEHTGNKLAPAPQTDVNNNADVVELDQIRKLAGLSK